MFQRSPSQTSSRGWNSEKEPSLASEPLAGFCTDVLPVNQSLRFFSVLLMPAETWTSCNTSPKSPEGLFWFLRLSRSRAVVFAGRGEEPRQAERKAGPGPRRGTLAELRPPALQTGGEGLTHAEQGELISCDIIELYTNNNPWTAEPQL